MLAPGEGRRHRRHHLALSLAVLAAPGQVLGDAVQQSERPFDVDVDQVRVELDAALIVDRDVGRIVVGIEGLHASTLLAIIVASGRGSSRVGARN